MPNLDFTLQQNQPSFPDGHLTSELAAVLPAVTLTSLPEVLLVSRYLKNHLCIDVRTVTSLTADSYSAPRSDKGTVWIGDKFFFSALHLQFSLVSKGMEKVISSPLSSFNSPWHILFPSCAQRQLLLRKKAPPLPTYRFVLSPAIFICQRTLGRHSFCSLPCPKLK